MSKLDFIKPESLSEALEILSDYRDRAVITAGATDLMVEMRAGKFNPKVEFLVDISSLDDMSFIREDDSLIRIGAATTHANLAESSIVQQYAPFLCKASGSVGSPQTRNRGTVGGNVITAAQCADTIPPLLVLDAVLVFENSAGSREISLESFCSAGDEDGSIQPDEILSEIYFKKPDSQAKSVFDKLIRRKAIAKSRISFCALAVQDSAARITDIRIVPGAVTPFHMRFREIEKMLKNQIPDKTLIKKAAEKISSEMISITGKRWSTPYKGPVLGIMAERGLITILEVGDE
jgi:CO/xanthine dehydrogenase FAD-binding subunit